MLEGQRFITPVAQATSSSAGTFGNTQPQRVDLHDSSLYKLYSGCADTTSSSWMWHLHTLSTNYASQHW